MQYKNSSEGFISTNTNNLMVNDSINNENDSRASNNNGNIGMKTAMMSEGANIDSNFSKELQVNSFDHLIQKMKMFLC